MYENFEPSPSPSPSPSPMTSPMGSLLLMGEIFRIYAVTSLIVHISRRNSCEGISARSQILFAVSYTIRSFDEMVSTHLDNLPFFYIVMLIVLMTMTVVLIYSYPPTYQRREDIFTTEILLIPCFLTSLWVNYAVTPLGMAHALGVYIESVAIVPQLYLILKERELERSILTFLIAMGLYKVVYIIYWFFLYQTLNIFDPIKGGAGVLYIILFFLSFVEFFIMGVKIT